MQAIESADWQTQTTRPLPTALFARPAETSVEQAFYLQRLAYLLARHPRLAVEAAPNRPASRLLKHATYSTYVDCIALGVGEQARALLRHFRAGAGVDESAAM